MPAQNPGATSQTAHYVEGDTAPPLRRQLLNGDGSPMELVLATGVTISIAWGIYHGSYYVSPRDRIVSESPCIIETVAMAGEDGWVRWSPGLGDLSPPGVFHYTFEVTWQDGTTQTVAPNTYEPMKIASRVGGRAFNKPPITGNE